MRFSGDVPRPYHCAVPEDTSINQSIPLVNVNGKWQYAECEMYANLSISNETVPCQHGYWYDPASGYTATLVSDVRISRWLSYCLKLLNSK